MPDLFHNPYKKTETWTAQGAIVNYGTGDKANSAIPLYMTNIQINYQRAVSALYPINVTKVDDATKVNITGAPRGTLSIGSIYSPNMQNMKAFLDAIAKHCKTTKEAVTMTFRPFGSACTKGSSNNLITIKGVELESIGFSIQGGEIAIVNIPTNYSFTSLDWNTEAPEE